MAKKTLFVVHNQAFENQDGIQKAKAYFFKADKQFDSGFLSALQEILVDPVSERFFWSIKDFNEAVKSGKSQTNELQTLIKTFKPGVTDNCAKVVQEALLDSFNLIVEVKSGELLFSYTNSHEDLEARAAQVYNSLIEQTSLESTFFPSFEVSSQMSPVQVLERDRPLEWWQEQNQKNCWALNAEEIQQMLEHFNQLGRNPTDVEVEVIAQSWSEHCKHKLFAAHIEYQEEADSLNKAPSIEQKEYQGLFSETIRKPTMDLINSGTNPWAISVFSDNAGIVRWDEKLDLCIKVETHNSPSALDPYGGALTGILGVNRDILGCGMGARPVANTNVFCVGDWREIEENDIELPAPLKNPKTILKGIHHGVQDGGNKSGIPTVNGAIVTDPNYTGKPLVYCGTVGVLPPDVPEAPTESNSISEIKNKPRTRPSWKKYHRPGDLIVMVGGRVGIDGIHGATFSSLELDENAPATAVQIGDPLTQKRVLDFIIAARDRGLFSALTDNGAGGLSSSVGEMAIETNGAFLELNKVPLKYPGLSPFEIMISEAQERMTVAVPPSCEDKFLELSKDYGVESTVLGQFTDKGNLKVCFNGKTVADLDLHFLHESLRPMKLKAKFKGPAPMPSPWHGQIKRLDGKIQASSTLAESLKKLLAHPVIQSKESLVRQYDHEVQASTLVKPFEGQTQSAPMNAGVIWHGIHGGSTDMATAIGCGIHFQSSYYDTYFSAQASVDEAVRNVICHGADPDRIALLDNFCWPDPVPGSADSEEGSHKLAQLVRACVGLKEICLEYKSPLVSGKDSMKNDFKTKDIQISVEPTLLVTAMGCVAHTDHLLTSEFKNAGDVIVLLSPYSIESLSSQNQLSWMNRIQSNNRGCTPPEINIQKQAALYRKMYQKLITKQKLKSLTDISDGGIFTAVFESCVGNSLGAHIKCPASLDHEKTMKNFLTNEPCGSFIASLSHDDLDILTSDFANEHLILGTVAEGDSILIESYNQSFQLNLNELIQTWRLSDVD